MSALEDLHNAQQRILVRITELSRWSPSSRSCVLSPPPSPPQIRPLQTGRRGSTRKDHPARLVDQSPGLTLKHVGEKLGVDSTSLYEPTRDLVPSSGVASSAASARSFRALP